jgi:uncharacterized protein (DUF3820 family)
MKMPFGKFKGTPIEDLDDGYLQWLAENMDNKPDIQQEAENQLTLRRGEGVPRREPR